jgi:cellulose synthase/poly-beta-1,6-N-acetylglucosamine synthase-like glycosyltransferase/spore germination protein YaaH/peptidoglycan/xylan/chitin deacetylase (PgdA/CDA1 family)
MSRQIFQTDNKSRWTRFKWSMRIIFFIAALLVAVFIMMLILDTIPSLPFRQDYRSVVTASKPFLKDNRYSKAYKGFRSFITDRKSHSNYSQEKREALLRCRRYQMSGDSSIARSMESWDKFPAGIRSAFYVSWDPKSLFSLKRNIRNLNLVIPEWFFINPKDGSLNVRIDAKGYNFMKKSGVPVMPILSNNFDQEFRPEGISRVLHNDAKRRALIASVLNQCAKNHFIGINIDIENLNENTDSYLTRFVRELSIAFHAHDMLVTQDVAPFNNDYNIRELARYNDYLFLMAYDENSVVTDPGPISSQKWIEASVDKLAKEVPSDKIVLGIGAYGYDWSSKPNDNESISFQEALSTASETESDIHFDNNTYNLSFAYQDEDDDNAIHRIFFTDAATHFNTMRFGAEYGLAGFSVWRLGTEDSRLWKFYNKDLSHNAAKQTDFRSLQELMGTNDVTYIGDGEVLDPLNTPHAGSTQLEVDPNDVLISEEHYKELPTTYQIRKYGHCGKKQLLLTFDDGPDETWTPKILDILARYHVQASFFMVGLQIEKNLPIVKRVYQDGHCIGNHTFTHRNVAKNTPKRTAVELELTRMLIECITGHSTILFRAPYNADSDPASMEELIPIILARQRNYLDVGESIDPEDWEVGIKADEIYKRVIKGVEQGNGHIILLHDAGGETRTETVKALPRIIEYLRSHGYSFISLPQFLGKNRSQLMPAIPKGKSYYAMQANLALATLTYDITKFLTALFIIFIIIGMGRLLFMVWLTVREKRREKQLPDTAVLPADAPHVSIIVPAYNEEVNAVSSLRNLLQQDYPNFDVIFVDDGSKDETYKRVCDALHDNPKVQIFTKPNGGKASALNYGIQHTDAEYVVCIDADTKLLSNAVSLLMTHFTFGDSAKTGAVAGNVKVGNQINMLTKWQAIEYTTSQNFDRMAYSNINAITVVPGAIGAFRKSAIEAAGGLTTDTLAEDCDLTIRILRAGYVIENENRAIALTEAPEKLRQFVKQRTRWSFGVMQTFWKHRDTLFSRRYHSLGLWAMPNMLVFQFIIPLFSPLADLFMIIGLFSGNAGRIFLYYLLFMAVDASISIAAYLFEKEKLSVLLWIIPQRFCYRWIMYVVLYRSFKRAIKGELQTWGVLKRTGNVKIANE